MHLDGQGPKARDGDSRPNGGRGIQGQKLLRAGLGSTAAHEDLIWEQCPLPTTDKEWPFQQTTGLSSLQMTEKACGRFHAGRGGDVMERCRNLGKQMPRVSRTRGCGKHPTTQGPSQWTAPRG